jgi:hypothetical protein
MKLATPVPARLRGLLLLLLAGCLLAGPARAATFLVNSGADTHDKDLTDGQCLDAAGNCTLRAAIEQGNALAGVHIINFVPGLTVTVGALGSMAQMRAKYIVNGNLATIDGQYVSGSSIGYGCLDLTDSGDPSVGQGTGAAGSVVANLSIVRCNGNGISANGHGYQFLNNRIGVDPTGLVSLPNSGNGMDLTASAVFPDSTTLQGIYNLLPPSLQPVDFSQINQFQIGLANALVSVAQPITVTGNVISGNGQNGIEVHGINMAAVFVIGNHIGTNITGTAAIPNGGSGVHLNASAFGNMVGPGNVISGNAVNGILADSGDVLLPNFVMGNRIGLGDDSSKHVGNGVAGIVTDTKPAGASPGPPNPSGTALVIGPANVISDNQGTNNPDPDVVSSESGAGVVMTGASSGVKVLGNTIGLAEFPSGTPVASTAYGNAGDGILVTVSGNTVGGSSSTTANVVAGNKRHGIVVNGTGTAGTAIKGNFIGVSPSFAGNLTLGNGYDGVHVDTASSSAIGGPNAGDGNVVAANGRNGIALRNGSSGSGWANLFQRNQVYGNARAFAGVGIDLERSPNAADDPARTEFANNYANGDQVQPVICAGPADTGACNGSNAAASTGGTTSLDWTIATHGGATFRIEVFSVNAASDNAATGASFLAEATVSTDASGNLAAGSANTTCAGSGPGRCTTSFAGDTGGASLVLTATDVTNLPVFSGSPGFGWYGALSCFLGFSSCPVNNTSELSNAMAVPPPAGPIMSTVPPQTGKVGVPFSLDVSAYVNPNGAAITLYAVGAGALPTILSLNGSTGLVSGTPSAAGSFSARIDATNANGTTHAPAVAFTIAKGDQTIAFGPPPALVAGGATKSVSAAASSTLAVIFTSLTASVCTISGANVTPLAVGMCTIAANQAGDANWNPAPQAQQSITVTAVAGTPPTWSASLPATQNVTVGVPYSFALSTYALPNASGDPILGYALASGTFPAGLTLNTTAGLVSGTPTAAVPSSTTAGVTVSDKNGPSASGPIQFNVAKGGQSINFGALANRTAGPAFTVSATASSGLAVSFSTASAPAICTVSGTQVTPVGPGTCTVHATQPGDANWNAATPVDQGFTITVPTVTHYSVSSPVSTAAGAPLSVTVSALDGTNAVVPAYTGTAHFTSTDAAAVLPADYTFTAGDAGAHTFANGVTLKSAGARTVTATDTVTSSITGSTASVAVASSSATHFVVAAPSNVTAGAAFTAAVTAFDAYGNVASGYGGTVHITATDAAAVLPANYTFTGGDAGVHAFTAGVTLKTAGANTLTATDTVTGTIKGTTSNVAVGPAAAASLTVTAPASAVDSVPLTITVAAFDAFANAATGYAGTVHFTSSDPAATLPADYHFTAGDAGSHTFTNGVTLKTTGTRTVTATDTVTATVTGTSGGIVVAAAASNTALATSVNPSVFGQGVTFTATVTSGSPGTPTGPVTFLDGASPLCSAVSLNPSAKATCTTSALSVGIHSITAAYAGDANFGGSTSTAASQTVSKAATTTVVGAVSPSSPSTTLQPLQVPATVAPGAPGAGTPTGTITISDGTGDTCTITLPATTCTLTVTSAGTKSITASYGGDPSFNASVSAAAGQTVNAVTVFNGTTATGTGTATAAMTGAGCTFTSAQFIPVAPLTPPPGTTFPHGLFDFRIGGCGAGGTATVQVVFPQTLATGAQYWKYGPTAAPQWYALQSGAPNFPSISGATVMFSITDGGKGDDDGLANGVIVDQGGPGVPPAGPGGVVDVPTLGALGLAALAALLLAAGLGLVRRIG